jgi:hypothetical protein
MQHALNSKHSTAINLFNITLDWLVSITNRLAIGVVFIDFSRAFNCNVFSKLLVEPNALVVDEAVNMARYFLHNRRQSIMIERCFSSV